MEALLSGQPLNFTVSGHAKCVARTSLMLEREVARLVDGIASGTLGASAAIAQRLKDSEAALARLKAQPVAPNKVAEQLLPDLAKRCRSVLQNLEQTIMIDPHRAQFEMRQHVGPDPGLSDADRDPAVCTAESSGEHAAARRRVSV